MTGPGLPRLRREGMALVMSLFVAIVIFGLVGAATAFSTALSRAKFDLFREVDAFYVAETALENAKREIGEDLDADGDGVGNRQGTFAGGSYRVDAVDLGGGIFRLDATATVGEITVALQEVIDVQSTSAFPVSALTLAGALPPSGLQLKQDTYGPGGPKKLIIDGRNSPGVGFTDRTLYDGAGTLFSDAAATGDLDLANLTGAVTNEFGGVELPFHHNNNPEDFLAQIATVYKETKLDVLHALGAVSPPTNEPIWGSPTTSSQFVVGDESLPPGTTVNGYGQLVINKKLVIEDGATLNWDGDIVVFGHDEVDSELVVGGDLNVTGNLIVLGQAERYSKLELTTNGTINVEGALTSLSDPKTKSQIQFLVEGRMNVDGILSILGPKIQAEFKDPSDTTVNGMIQVGAPTDANDFLLKWEGDFEVHKDDAWIQAGIDALAGVGVSLDLTGGGLLLTDEREVRSLAWKKLKR